MHRAAHSKKSVHAPAFIGAIVIVLLIASLCMGVYAYLQWQSGKIENNFTAADSNTPSVNETFENNVKTDVFVNVGDTGYSVYVRASVVVVWKDAVTGNVLPTVPKMGIDYSLTLNNTDWFYYNGYYYHKSPVNSGEKTADLIEECKLLVAPVAGYHLEVKIVAQTIQFAGTTDEGETPAVTAAWGVQVSSEAGHQNELYTNG